MKSYRSAPQEKDERIGCGCKVFNVIVLRFPVDILNTILLLGRNMTVIEVRIELKKGVADPEGENTRKALEMLGFDVKKVHSVKVFDIEVEEKDKKKAVAEVEEMCRKLLANPVIHKYRIEVKRD